MTSVIHFSSADAGAPSLSNAAGSLVAVLDACLVNGYGSKPVTSITVAAGVATVVCSAHGFGDQSVQEIAGATPALLNGRKLITVTGSNSFTFPAPGVPDGVATGTITAKRPGLGWTKQFSSGATKAVYRRTDPAATAMVLRVADTGAGTYDTATGAEVTMYESMTGVDSGSSPVPPVHGQVWSKGPDNAIPKRWILVGDSRTFYFFSEPPNGAWTDYRTLTPSAFGDFRSYRASDAYACALHGPYTSAASCSGILESRSISTAMPADGSCLVARRVEGVLIGTHIGSLGHAGGAAPMASAGPVFPSPVDNGGALAFPIRLCDSSVGFVNPVRGEHRGLAEPLFNCVGLGETVFRSVIGSDRAWLILPGYTSATSNRAFVAIDITGPWQV